MKKGVILFLLILILLATGCVSTQAVRLGEGPILPPIPYARVIIYRTADQVTRPYKEIALLSAAGDSLWTSEEQMYKEMRKRAGKLGANAIILDAMSEPSQGAQVATYILLGIGGNRRGKALAIYVEPEQKQSPRSLLK